MKTVSGVAILACVCAFSFLSCGSGSGYSGTLNCRSLCDKNESCCDADPDCDPWDDYRREGCMRDCDEWNKTFTEEFLQGYEECSKLPCASSETLQCADELMASCAGPPAEQVDSICTRRVECSFDTSMRECTAAIERQMACYTQKAVDAMESCTLSANCNTFHDDLVNCFWNELDIIPRQ